MVLSTAPKRAISSGPNRVGRRFPAAGPGGRAVTRDHRPAGGRTARRHRRRTTGRGRAVACQPAHWPPIWVSRVVSSSRSTARLMDEGLVSGRSGGGTIVLDAPAPAAPPHRMPVAPEPGPAAASPAGPGRGVDLFARKYRPVGFSARHVVARRTHCADRDTSRGAGLRRPTRAPPAARRAGALAGPNPRSAGHARRRSSWCPASRRRSPCWLSSCVAKASPTSRWRIPDHAVWWTNLPTGAQSGPGPGGRGRARHRRTGGERGPRRIPHTGPSVPDRCGAGARPAPRAVGVGCGAALCHRGRLRRRIPLRPSAGAGAARRCAGADRLLPKHYPRASRRRCGWAGWWRHPQRRADLVAAKHARRSGRADPAAAGAGPAAGERRVWTGIVRTVRTRHRARRDGTAERSCASSPVSRCRASRPACMC